MQIGEAYAGGRIEVEGDLAGAMEAVLQISAKWPGGHRFVPDFHLD